MKNTTISPKGQVVIPMEFRRKLGLKPGVKVTFLEKEGELTLIPRTSVLASKYKGFLADDKRELNRVYRESKREELRAEEKKPRKWGKR